MSENMKVFPHRKHLVLAFDAGCTMCSELASKIEERVGEKLEVRPMHNLQVDHWRKQALGEDAPWTPTLIEVNGGEVRAWTGLGMSIALSWRLGPIGSWQVLQAISEARAARNEAEHSLQVGLGGITRGQFLKALGGAAITVSALSGVAAVASPSTAATRSTSSTTERQRIQREFTERFQQTPVGKSFNLVNENGNELTFKRTAKNTAEAVTSSSKGAVPQGEQQFVAQASFCVQAVLAAAYAVGAFALATAAAAGTSLILAGYVVGPQVLNALAIAIGGGGAAQSIIALYIC